jgi:polysaccharide export outer membrane protein
MGPLFRRLLPFFLFVALVGCSSTQPYIWANRLGKLEDDAQLYRIGPGDEIYVLVAEQEQLSGKFTIGPDGRYAHPIVGSVALNGLTLAEATQHLTQRLAGILVRPQVTVSLLRRRPIRISVMGEVKTAGRFELEHDESVLSAIARAGGLTEFADPDSIYVVRREPTLLRIRFRLRDLAGQEATSSRFRLSDGDVILAE